MISSNTGGLPEFNLNGVTGFMSDVGDVDDMAKNSIYLLENEERLSKFKLQALEQAKKFDIRNILPMYEKLYEKVISAK